MEWRLVGRVANPWGQVPVPGGGQAVNPRVQEYMANVAAAALRRDRVSRRHHYVPQAYMKAWSSDGRRVRVLDTVNGSDRKEAFGGWIDADRDGCNTRAEVLLAEAVEQPTVTGRCTLTGGSRYSWYDDRLVDRTDIDHAVPLAEARDSGASRWTKACRVAYANYLGDDGHLVAVSQRSNRQKADKDVAAWNVPDNPSQRCRYLSDQVAIKLGWHLSVDPAEHAATQRIAANCPRTDVTVESAP
ncbi:GmrSD restriction endonuclease domain-containing protein [Streptomyces olivaceoviridis]